MFKRIYIILLTININSIHAMRIFSKGGSKTIISSSLKQGNGKQVRLKMIE